MSTVKTASFASNPAQYVRRPAVHRAEGHGLDRSELGRFLFAAAGFDHSHGALTDLLGLNGLRVSEASGSNVEDLGLDRGHRTLRIVGKGSKPAVIPLVPRSARTIDLAFGERREGPILLRASDGAPVSATSTRTCCGRRSSWRRSTPGFRSSHDDLVRSSTPGSGPPRRLRRRGVRQRWVSRLRTTRITGGRRQVALASAPTFGDA
jgi:integrase